MRIHHPISAIFGDSGPVRLLRLLVRSSRREWTAPELAEASGLSVMGAHKALKKLQEEGLVSMWRIGKTFVFALNKNNPEVRQLLTPLFSREAALSKEILRLVVESLSSEAKKNIASLVLFGSVAEKKEGPASDLDFLIVVKAARGSGQLSRDLNDLKQSLLERYGIMFSPIVMPENMIRGMSKRSHPLIESIRRTGKVIYGKRLEEILS